MNGDNIPTAKKPLHRKIFLLANRFMFAISRKHNRNDVKVAMLSPGKNYPAASLKIDQALNLISKYDPRRYLQIRRDVKKIWISATPGYCANWMDELQMCTIDSNYFYRDNVSASEIALTIIHESTHARLCKLKIEYTEDIRDRVERVCIKSEIAFAKRLPDGQKFVEMVESKLQIPKSYWTDTQFQQRDLDAFAELCEKNWLARIFYPIAKRRLDKRNARLQSRETD
ncbi:MAG: hypothetical protein ABSF60_11225 [Verrucomicrobiota bacterium]